MAPHRSQRLTVTTRCGKRRRAPPGGRATPAHGPALGGEAGSVLMGQLIRKVPLYARIGIGFATTSSLLLTDTPCSIS